MSTDTSPMSEVLPELSIISGLQKIAHLAAEAVAEAAYSALIKQAHVLIPGHTTLVLKFDGDRIRVADFYGEEVQQLLDGFVYQITTSGVRTITFLTDQTPVLSLEENVDVQTGMMRVSAHTRTLLGEIGVSYPKAEIGWRLFDEFNYFRVTERHHIDKLVERFGTKQAVIEAVAASEPMQNFEAETVEQVSARYDESLREAINHLNSQR